MYYIDENTGKDAHLIIRKYQRQYDWKIYWPADRIPWADINYNDYPVHCRHFLGREYEYNEDGFDYFGGIEIPVVNFYLPFRKKDNQGKRIKNIGFTSKDKSLRLSKIEEALQNFRYLNLGQTKYLLDIALLLDGCRTYNPVSREILENLVNEISALPSHRLRPIRTKRKGRIDPDLNWMAKPRAIGKLSAVIRGASRQREATTEQIRKVLTDWDPLANGYATHINIAKVSGVSLSTVIRSLTELSTEFEAAQKMNFTDSMATVFKESGSIEIRKIQRFGISIAESGIVYGLTGKQLKPRGKKNPKVQVYHGGKQIRLSIIELLNEAGFAQKNKI